MLSAEEQQNIMRYNIQLDHCYTSRMSPSDPIPRDPLPIADSPDSDDVRYITQPSSPRTTIVSPSNDMSDSVAKNKNIVKSVSVIIIYNKINIFILQIKIKIKVINQMILLTFSLGINTK